MGQAAFLSKKFSAVPLSFYASIPGKPLQGLRYHLKFAHLPFLPIDGCIRGFLKPFTPNSVKGILDKYHVGVLKPS